MKTEKRLLCGLLAGLLLCSLLLAGCGETPVETTPALTTPAESTAGQTVPTETTSAETTPAEATVAETTPAETTAEETTVPVTPPVIVPTQSVAMTDDEIYDKLLGSWLGQMIGVAWCANTEFAYHGSIMPLSRISSWTPSMISGAFGQDDVYVEIPFLEAMRRNGYDCDPRYLAEEFKNSSIGLWHANLEGRNNLIAGIEFPYSGSYLYNQHCDDIDWQIEADAIGMIYPGMVNEAATRAFDLGHIMNYGDGVYGGVMVAAMHAAAYTASSIEEIVDAGLAVIPNQTKFKDLMNDLMGAYYGGKTWEETWQILQDKWGDDDRCPTGVSSSTNIDAKLNAAYIVIGLLYGKGDFADTILISCRCGQDSDCNPSSAASILGNFLGASNIAETYKSGLNWEAKFAETDYTFRQAIEVNFDLAKECLAATATKDGDKWQLVSGGTYYAVPYEQWPETFYVSTWITKVVNRGIALRYQPFFGEIASMEIDFGDGYRTMENAIFYQYDQPGEYRISCKFVSTNGETFRFEMPVTIENNLRVPGKAICSVTEPTGGSSKDVNTIYDGIVPLKNYPDKLQQYITSDGNPSTDPIYAGVAFDLPATITGVAFTEGIHFSNGGWFEAVPDVEVLIDGVWTKVTVASVSPDYPIGGQKDHGDFFDTYTFTFAEEVKCDGVRLIGVAGGAGRYISVGEITPIVKAIHEKEKVSAGARQVVICSQLFPNGQSRNAGVICDSEVPGAGANYTKSFNTYGILNIDDTYIGYQFKKTYTVSKVLYTAGVTFTDGGWFYEGAPRIEGKVNGEWKTVGATVSPPVGTSASTPRHSL